MRVALIGHASILIETAQGNCLMDPVFFDPFEGGAVSSCPERVVDLAELPSIDLLIVSHRHPDHFDIASLARIPKDCQVFCPRDPLIVYGLKRLGFEGVTLLDPMQPISSWDLQLLPTRSEARGWPEAGIVLADGTGVFWNQVDTPLSLETIRFVLERFGRVDLLFAMYASQNFEFFESRHQEFPYETHRQNLETVLAIQPRAVVPASAGFKFCGQHAWLNRFLFPVSRERFLADLSQLDPAIKSFILDPGDVIEVSSDGISASRSALKCSRLIRDNSDELRFDPTAPIPPLLDPNPDGYAEDHMDQVISPFIEDGLFRYAQDQLHNRLSVAWRYCSCRAAYELEVLFPERSKRWLIDFRSREPALHLNSGPDPDVVHRIAASALTDWIQRKKGFFYTRAYSRRFSTLYQLSSNAASVQLSPLILPDLLMHYLLNEAEDAEDAARRRVDFEIEQALAGQ
jgi:L-ascorbate metabolism protein UlaG (beta-lactamase superfamily)